MYPTPQHARSPVMGDHQTHRDDAGRDSTDAADSDHSQAADTRGFRTGYSPKEKAGHLERRSAIGNGVDAIENDVHLYVSDWWVAANRGVGNFATQGLENRINRMAGGGGWDSFIATMLGGTIWAAAAFVTGGTSLAFQAGAFAVGEVGMSLQATTSMPKASGRGTPITHLKEAMQGVLDRRKAALDAKVGAIAAEMVASEPILYGAGNAIDKRLDRNRLLQSCLRAVFKPEYVIASGGRPRLATGAISKETKRRAVSLFHRWEKQVSPIGKSEYVQSENAFASPGHEMGHALAEITSLYGGKRLALVLAPPSWDESHPYKFERWISSDLASAARQQAHGKVLQLSTLEVDGLADGLRF